MKDLAGSAVLHRPDEQLSYLVDLSHIRRLRHLETQQLRQATSDMQRHTIADPVAFN